jgi:hypothetical protein
VSVQRAKKFYQNFREREPTRARKIRIRLPAAVAVMGYVEAIMYFTTHGTKSVRYKHKFAAGSRPLLTTDGKALYLIGGRYHVTERGIVDLTKGGKEIED